VYVIVLEKKNRFSLLYLLPQAFALWDGFGLVNITAIMTVAYADHIQSGILQWF